jgi:signal transduction histidine kinase
MEHEFEKLESVIMSRGTYQKRVEQAKELLAEMKVDLKRRRRDLAAMKFSLRLTDLFRVVDEVVREWEPKAVEAGVEVTTRIPERGPTLLMNEDRIRLALANILRTMTSCVTEGDKVMVECSTGEDRVTVAIADTGSGLPGNLLSRLFMPFSDMDQGDEFKTAMSLAGDVLHHHAGEIMVKSSPSWKTILVISFPLAANKDRRKHRSDRRRRSDRRGGKKLTTGRA